MLKKFFETNIKMLEFLIGNIFAMLGGRVFQQTIGFPTGTNYAPLLASLLICSFEVNGMLIGTTNSGISHKLRGI
jgi:hypothetical protein